VTLSHSRMWDGGEFQMMVAVTEKARLVSTVCDHCIQLVSE